MTAQIKKTKRGRVSRYTAGVLISAVGVGLNLLLCGVKLAGGRLSGSVAITADGFNNLADACTCLLTLAGFLLSARAPDRKYPMGRGRLEYLSGLTVSAAILFIGIKMLYSSVIKLLHPDATDSSTAVLCILMASLAVKGALYVSYRRAGKTIGSPALRAAALDSLCDCCATLVILISLAIEKLTGLRTDGFGGIPVALCILYAGITALKENAAPLLGKGLDEKSAEKLFAICRTHRQIRSVRRVRLHDYGADHRLLSFYLNAEEPLTLIPLLRKEIAQELRMEAVICPLYDDDE